MNIQKLLKSVGTLLAISSIVWFAYQIFIHSSSLPSFGGMAVLYLGLIILSYSISSVIVGGAWYFWLLSVGEQQVGLWRVVSICCLSQIGKYVPGNIAHHVGRVVLARHHGLGVTNTLFSIFLEAVWAVAVAALLSLIAIMIMGRRFLVEVPYLPQWWVLGGVIGVTLLAPLLSHRVFKSVMRWWALRKGLEVRLVRMPSLLTFWLVGLLYTINYLILGVVLWLIAEHFFTGQGGGILLLSGIFAVAWIVGFITPGAPAGLGVREVVLVAALTPVYGNENSVGIAAVLRCVTVLGDGASFLMGLGIAKFIDKKVTVDCPDE